MSQARVEFDLSPSLLTMKSSEASFLIGRLLPLPLSICRSLWRPHCEGLYCQHQGWCPSRNALAPLHKAAPFLLLQTTSPGSHLLEHPPPPRPRRLLNLSHACPIPTAHSPSAGTQCRPWQPSGARWGPRAVTSCTHVAATQRRLTAKARVGKQSLATPDPHTLG